MRAGSWVALLLLLIVGGFAVHVMTGHVTTKTAPSGGGPPIPIGDGAPQLPFKDSQSCKACHAEVYAEWLGSHHQISYTNPEVQRLTKGFTNRDCLPCHLPRPVYETGLAFRVLERETRHDEGIDCLACHQSHNAMIGKGPFTKEQEAAPCNPRAHPSMGTNDLCASCHDQHKVHRDWAETRFSVPGEDYKDCNACHMPEVDRASGKKGRHHGFPGAHSKEMLATAMTVTVAKDGSNGRALQIVVHNSGCGHNFPADERYRAGDLELILEGDQGVSALRVDRYRNPYREQFHLKNHLREPGAERDYVLAAAPLGDVAVHVVRVAAEHHPNRTVHYPESTQIPAGEKRNYRLLLPEGTRKATVLLRYRLHPYQTDEEAVELFRETLEL